MLEMLRDWMAHKQHANAAVLNAIRQNSAVVSDGELWESSLALDAAYHAATLPSSWKTLAIGLVPLNGYFDN
jgi:hypothetical protein